jgi:hypothetical protein
LPDELAVATANLLPGYADIFCKINGIRDMKTIELKFVVSSATSFLGLSALKYNQHLLALYACSPRPLGCGLPLPSPSPLAKYRFYANDKTFIFLINSTL